MSDGAMEGARHMRAFQERQAKFDQIFTLIIDHVTKTEASAEALTAAFDIFDEARFVGYGSAEFIKRGRDLRRKSFLNWMGVIKHALSNFLTREGELAWAELMTLGLLHASPEVFDELREASLFRGQRIALFAPNGYGGRSNRLYGDLESVLDAVAGFSGSGARTVRVIRIEHDEPTDGQHTKLLFMFT